MVRIEGLYTEVELYDALDFLQRRKLTLRPDINGYWSCGDNGSGFGWVDEQITPQVAMVAAMRRAKLHKVYTTRDYRLRLKRDGMDDVTERNRRF